MSATQIYIASAGSGKTFTLVKEYLKIVFNAAHHGHFTVFKNILAITFTNKATLEMKQRIVHELKQIALGKETDQLKALRETYPYIKDFQFLADGILIKLLHDYSNFNIQTIDSFFQNIIKVFAKELDLPLNYEVIINTDEGIEYAVDGLMDQIGRNATITKWLEEYAYSQMDDEKSWDFRSILKSLSLEVFNKENSNQETTLTLKEVGEIKNKLQESTQNFEKHVQSIAAQMLEVLEQQDFPIDGLQTYFYKPITKLSDGEKGNAFDFSNSFKAFISGEKSYLKKTTEKKYAAEIISLQSTHFETLISDLNEIFEDQYPTYIGYSAIFQNIYALAVVNQVSTFLKQYREEKNALFLMDTAKLINGFISIDDTPFLFEKLANRIQYLFIDEFQDTSTLQWENLRPIIENILSSADKPLQVLIVGDAKQSIYRFRGGDYELLTHKAADSLMNYNGEPISLNDNWRSLPSIVEFNNSFFETAVDTATFSDNTELHADMKLAYKGLKQNGQQKHAEGLVNIAIFDNKEKDGEDKALEKMIQDIRMLEAKGYRLDQMAILVKTKKDGVKISQHLQANAIEIVSQETLLLRFDGEVKLLLAALSYINQKTEDLYYTNLIHQYALVNQIEIDQHTLFSNSKTKSLLAEWLPDFEVKTSGEQQLLHLFETLLQLFNISATSNLFVSHFKQIVINFYKKTSTNLSDFMEWWALEGATKSVIVEESKDKIKVMTIHKSKGLEFPVVLMPFCNWKFKNNIHKNYLWVNDASIHEGITFPIKATSNLANSQYAEPFHREIKLNWIDNVNQLYVAFTRAKEVLLVTCNYENINKDGDLNTAAQLVRKVLEDQNIEVPIDDDFVFEKGSLDQLPSKEESKNDELKAQTMIPKSDTYQHLEIDQKVSTSSMDIGNLVHMALFYLTSNSPEIAFAKAAAEDNYSRSSIENAKTHFFNIISKESQFGEWLNENIQSWDEQTIYYDSQELRPDKVMELKDKFVILDYKTGEPMKKYHRKLKKYIQAVEAMQVQKPIEAYILYTENGVLEEVMIDAD